MWRRRRRPPAWVVVATLVAVTAGLSAWWLPSPGRVAPAPGGGVFQVKPYLQLGEAPGAGGDGRESLALLWQAADRADGWEVDVRAEPADRWVAASQPTSRRVAVDGAPPFRVYRASLAGLTPGLGFAYRVRTAGAVVFEARGSARQPAGRPHRFVVFGDCGAGTAGQSAVAYRAYLARPDYVILTGDLVYTRGRVSEYLAHFFPVYNRDEPSPRAGAPLMRSTPFVAAPGNHDLIERDLDKVPDGLAYFYYWSQPMNGPPGGAAAAGAEVVKGSAGKRRAFREAAGPAFPRMTNFSFDSGDVHWTVLDANTYTDWTDPALRAWLDADLASARRAAWRLVAFHHPAFHSSKAHADDQRMRLLAPSLEKGKVALVFNGHVHNYQRTHPLRFAVGPPPVDGKSKGKPYGPTGKVDGVWTLDTAYDGATRTRPDGPIYVVTGAGGAKLYDPSRHDDPASWQDFTARFVSNVHSLTVVDVTPDALTVRQVSADGDEIDRFVLTR